MKLYFWNPGMLILSRFQKRERDSQRPRRKGAQERPLTGNVPCLSIKGLKGCWDMGHKILSFWRFTRIDSRSDIEGWPWKRESFSEFNRQFVTSNIPFPWFLLLWCTRQAKKIRTGGWITSCWNKSRKTHNVGNVASVQRLVILKGKGKVNDRRLLKEKKEGH